MACVISMRESSPPRKRRESGGAGLRRNAAVRPVLNQRALEDVDRTGRDSVLNTRAEVPISLLNIAHKLGLLKQSAAYGLVLLRALGSIGVHIVYPILKGL
jgi:hypothetical protein